MDNHGKGGNTTTGAQESKEQKEKKSRWKGGIAEEGKKGEQGIGIDGVSLLGFPFRKNALRKATAVRGGRGWGKEGRRGGNGRQSWWGLPADWRLRLVCHHGGQGLHHVESGKGAHVDNLSGAESIERRRRGTGVRSHIFKVQPVIHWGGIMSPDPNHNFSSCREASTQMLALHVWRRKHQDPSHSPSRNQTHYWQTQSWSTPTPKPTIRNVIIASMR